MKCQNCRKSVVFSERGAFNDEKQWVHELTGETSCNLHATVRRSMFRITDEGKVQRND